MYTTPPSDLEQRDAGIGQAQAVVVDTAGLETLLSVSGITEMDNQITQTPILESTTYEIQLFSLLKAVK